MKRLICLIILLFSCNGRPDISNESFNNMMRTIAVNDSIKECICKIREENAYIRGKSEILKMVIRDREAANNAK